MTEQLGLFESRRDLSLADLARAPLSIRESRRARYLTLRLLPPHTLELVVPRGTRAADVDAFVRENRRWIEDARRELAECRPLRREGLPVAIDLRAIGERWDVVPLDFVPAFYADEGFLGSFEAVAKPALAEARPDHVLFSFHGLPERQIKKSDPTGSHCLASPSCCA